MTGTGYTNIPDWMLAYDLDVYETIILAVIYGFSQDDESTFSGSQRYLAQKAKCSRQKVTKALPSLVEKGLVIKIDKEIRGVKMCEYKVSPMVTGCNGELQGGCNGELHNNIDNKNIDNKSMYKEKPFNFKSALLEIGVSEPVADAWMKVRKTKRATNTEIAFNKVRAEVNRSGLAADNAIRIAVENSWSGFKADWLKDQRTERRNVPPKKKESVFEHNLKVMDQMFGTDLHGQAYKPKQNDYDEQ